MSRMHTARRSTARAAMILAFAGSAAGLLTACGGDNSATGNPNGMQSSAAQESGGHDGSTSPSTSKKNDGDKSGDESGRVTNPGPAATAPPEQPQPAPSGFPGPAAAPIDERGKSFVAALDKAGIKSSGNGENAVAIANYICTAQHDGSPQDQIDTNVTAMAGVELNLSGAKLKPADAAKVYEDAAQKTYCK